MLYFRLKKKAYKRSKDIASVGNKKVIEMKDTVVLVKVNEMCNILKSVLTTV